MTPEISNELEQAITAHPEGALKVQGANGTYWFMTDEAMQVRADVQKGLDQVDCGDVQPWNADEIKEVGRDQRLGQSPQAAA